MECTCNYTYKRDICVHKSVCMYNDLSFSFGTHVQLAMPTGALKMMEDRGNGHGIGCAFLHVHHLDARATRYRPIVREWTVLIETDRDIVAIFPTKSSSCWVHQQRGFMLGIDFLFCTSSSNKISPNEWYFGMNFQRVIPMMYALWAHFWNEFTHLYPDFKRSFLSSSDSHKAALYMHLMKVLAALIAAWISRKIGLRVSSIVSRCDPMKDSRKSSRHTVSAPLNQPLRQQQVPK